MTTDNGQQTTVLSFAYRDNFVFSKFLSWLLNLKSWKLEIRQLATELSDKIDQLTQTFSKHEIFILTSQIKRAANSVSLNIAEDSTGQSDAEQVRFLRYTCRSAIEVVNGLYLSRRRNYLSGELFSDLYVFTENLIIKIQAMIRKLE